MPVVITCPACGKKARVPSKTVGKTVRCPRCDTTYPATPDDGPPDLPAEPNEAGDSPAEPAGLGQAERKGERTGVGLLALGQGLLAVSLALQLIVSLIQLATTDAPPRPRGIGPGVSRPSGTFVESFGQLLTVVGAVAQAGATVVVLVGAAYTVLSPAAPPLRAAGGAVLVLGLVAALNSANSFGELIRGATENSAGIFRGGFRAEELTSGLAGQVITMTLTPIAIGAGLQTMLAILARGHARRQRDRAVARLSGGLAFAYPAVVIGIYLLVVLAGIFGSQSHPTFDQVMSVLDRLFRTALVAAGAFVLWRAWTGLTS